jgi:hypothetical protein
VTDLGNNEQENQEVPASEMDDESLFDRLFPDELVAWIRELFGRDEEE